MPSVLFASPHCYLESASGAVVAMRDLFHQLGRRGWECRVVTSTIFDAAGLTLDKAFKQLNIAPKTAQGQCGDSHYAVHRGDADGVPVLVYEPRQWSRPPGVQQGYPFLQLLDRSLSLHRPDVMLTFGGSWLGRGVTAVARRHGVPVVFWLRNTAYDQADLFQSAAAIIVPSEFSARHYRQHLNLECHAIPSPIRPERVVAPHREQRYVTFISPTPVKGVFYFARIAAELGRQRPDIPVLVVVGRGNLNVLAKAELNLRSLPNFRVMPATTDPREFWSVTRILLVPSLWKEVFLRLGPEAMFNGVPVLASRRGAIPDTLGSSGFLFDIPEEYKPAELRLPTAEEVVPWVNTIIRLCDDPVFYQENSDRSRAEAKRFDLPAIVQQHEDVLRNAMVSARPPAAEPLPPLAADLLSLGRFFTQPPQFQQLAPLSNEIESLL